MRSTQDRVMRSALLSLLIVASAVLLSSCAFHRLKTDVAVGNEWWLLKATMKEDKKVEGDVIVVIYTPYEDGQRVAAFKIVDPAVSKAYFVLDPGDYRLAIFLDRNKNLTLDSDEPAELYNGGRRLAFSEVTKRIELTLEVPTRNTLPKEYPRELASLPESIQDTYNFAMGEAMDINDPKFSAAAGKMGLWEPSRFLKEYGGGIYMLEPYDPKRIPVLFIHGAGGSAQNWTFFFDRLDKTRYQAWFLLYPSGMRIEKLGRSLNTLLRATAEKYGAARVHVVAHSMGGLVGREALVAQLGDGKPQLVDEFVTISTPWNGHRMAEKGVRALSTPVPSWHDVVPGSDFLQTVFNTPLKPKIHHHLVFGYQMDSEEDGSVALNSVLLKEAQEDAVDLRAFEADHVGILFMEDVLDYVESLLIEADENAAAKDTDEQETPAADATAAPMPDNPLTSNDEGQSKPTK